MSSRSDRDNGEAAKGSKFFFRPTNGRKTLIVDVDKSLKKLFFYCWVVFFQMGMTLYHHNLLVRLRVVQKPRIS